MSRYYLIYFSDDFQPRTDIGIYSRLYAYTDNKQLIKRFKSERNLKKFMIKKEDLTSYDLRVIHDVNPSGYLEEVEGYTKSLHTGIKEKVTVLMSHSENIFINRMGQGVILSDLWENTECNPYVLKSKYLDALRVIGYVNGFNMLHMTEKTPTHLCYSVVEGDLQVDILNAFLYHFGDMLV